VLTHYFGVNDADLHLLMFSFKSQWSDAAEATDERTDKQTDKQTDGSMVSLHKAPICGRGLNSVLHTRTSAFRFPLRVRFYSVCVFVLMEGLPVGVDHVFVLHKLTNPSRRVSASNC